MNKYARRLKNVRRLISDRCGGSQAVFAEKTGLTPNYVSRMLYPEGKAQKKRIAEDTVDRIEAAFKLGRGWMDDLVDPAEFAEVFDCLQRVPEGARKACAASMTGIAAVYLQATDAPSAKVDKTMQDMLNPLTTGLTEKPVDSAEPFTKTTKTKKRKSEEGRAAKIDPNPPENVT